MDPNLGCPSTIESPLTSDEALLSAFRDPEWHEYHSRIKAELDRRGVKTRLPGPEDYSAQRESDRHAVSAEAAPEREVAHV